MNCLKTTEVADISKSYNILQVMDFAAAYPGNFISSIETLEKQIVSEDGKLVYVFPERAKTRDWAIRMAEAGKPVYFLPSKTLKAAALLRRLVKQYNISIIHSHFAAVNMYLPIRLARIGSSRIPHLVHAHSLPKRQPKPVLDFIRYLLIDEKLTVCVSKAVAKAYESRGRKCIVVTNAIDFSRLSVFEALDKNQYSNLPDNSLVMMMGYNFKVKGIDLAIKALNEFDKEHEIILLICVASHLERAKEQIVEILGEIPAWIRILPPRDDIASYYRLVDVFASASRTEGLPYSIIEAAFCGTPIVASDIEPHKELEIPFAAEFEGENGEQFYNEIKKMLSRPAEQCIYESLTEKTYVENTFTMEKWTQQITEIYTSII